VSSNRGHAAAACVLKIIGYRQVPDTTLIYLARLVTCSSSRLSQP
jgi:hypothetical protein